jgi:hypothetical protein
VKRVVPKVRSLPPDLARIQLICLNGQYFPDIMLKVCIAALASTVLCQFEEKRSFTLLSSERDAIRFVPYSPAERKSVAVSMLNMLQVQFIDH